MENNKPEIMVGVYLRNSEEKTVGFDLGGSETKMPFFVKDVVKVCCDRSNTKQFYAIVSYPNEELELYITEKDFYYLLKKLRSKKNENNN